MPRSTQPYRIIKDLGDGLVIRRARPEDAEELGAFNARVLADAGPDHMYGSWTRGILGGLHPSLKARDFTVVVDTARGEIVSSACLFSQQWAYGGILFGVGRPELVATHPDYRRRGLVRAQFEVIQAWSTASGQLVQAINGIPYFYRQFGYETAVDMWTHRRLLKTSIPALKEGEEEPYRVRPATEADVPFMSRLHAQSRSRYLVSFVIASRKLWHYLVVDREPLESFHVIESAGGERVGFLVRGNGLENGGLGVGAFELKPGLSWLAVQPSVLRALARVGAEYAARDNQDFTSLLFGLGTQHPFYTSASGLLGPPQGSNAFYVRVPDLPAFLRHIAPVLEARLAQSVAPGWSGELKLSFYRDGLRLVFAQGKLAAAEAWRPVQGEESAYFRDLTFLQMLFGLHSLEELQAASPDCYPSGNDAAVLLGILFPKQPSDVWTAM